MISTNELSFPMPAANLIAQRDPHALCRYGTLC